MVNIRERKGEGRRERVKRKSAFCFGIFKIVSVIQKKRISQMRGKKKGKVCNDEPKNGGFSHLEGGNNSTVQNGGVRGKKMYKLKQKIDAPFLVQTDLLKNNTNILRSSESLHSILTLCGMKHRHL